MHYCNWHLADYMSHTAHLTRDQDLAYRRMLDQYYLHESPLRGTAKSISHSIRMPECEADVRLVLASFFVRSPDGYRNKRADAEIARYRAKVEQASNAGRASVQRRLNGRSTDVQRAFNEASERTFNHPRTNNQEPIANPNPSESSGPLSTGVPSCSPSENGLPEQDDLVPVTGPEDREGPEPAVPLFDALWRTTFRIGHQHRFRELGIAAKNLAAAGITPADLVTLANKAGKRGNKPGGLFAHWIDNIPEALKELGKR